MGTRYSHVTLDEGCRLRGLMEMGLGPGEIARRLGRHRGTLMSWRLGATTPVTWSQEASISRQMAPAAMIVESGVRISVTRILTERIGRGP